MARNTGNTEIDTNPNTTSAIKKIQGHSNYKLNQLCLTISFSNEDVKIKHYILYKKNNQNKTLGMYYFVTFSSFKVL